MHNKLNNEQGYMLPMTLLILAVVTILGVLLMNLTASGIAKNDKRESNIQSHNLAVKGEDYFALHLTDQVEKALGVGKKVNDYKNILNTVLNDYACPSDDYKIWPSAQLQKLEMESDTGKTYYCVSNAENADEHTPNAGTLKNVEVLSIGISNNGGETKLYSTHQIGIPFPYFPHALSSHLNPDAPLQGFNGTLLLFGGTKSIGGIDVAKHIVTSNQINFKDRPVDSVYPMLHNTQNESQLNVSYQGKTYKASETLENMIQNGELLLGSNDEKNIEAIINDRYLLSINKTKNDDFYDKPPINVLQNIQARQTSPTNSDIAQVIAPLEKLQSAWLGKDLYSITNMKRTEDNIYLVPQIDPQKNPNNTFRVFGHENEFKNVSFYNDLELRYAAEDKTAVRNLGTVKLKVDNAYIKGNLNIGYLDQELYNVFKRLKGAELESEKLKEFLLEDLSAFDSILHKSSIELNGNYYIDGDVRIVNAQLTRDANLYVGGNVTILFSTLGREVTENGVTKTEPVKLNILQMEMYVFVMFPTITIQK